MSLSLKLMLSKINIVFLFRKLETASEAVGKSASFVPEDVHKVTYFFKENDTHLQKIYYLNNH